MNLDREQRVSAATVDASYRQDADRRRSSLTDHSATALRSRALAAAPAVLEPEPAAVVVPLNRAGTAWGYPSRFRP